MDSKSAIVGAAIALLLIVLLGGVYALGRSGSSSGGSEAKATAVPSPASSTPAPAVASPATPTPAPPPTEQAPPAAPVTLPDRTNCAEIRGTAYRSETERQWFIANCTTPAAAPTSRPPTAGAPTSSGCFVSTPLFDSTIYVGSPAPITARFTCNGQAVTGELMIFALSGYSSAGQLLQGACNATTNSNGYGSCSAVVPLTPGAVLVEVCVTYRGTLYCASEIYY
ncbi:MAG TPA: hypothetical protein VII57_02615 [Dehalococcoidia bacterium]